MRTLLSDLTRVIIFILTALAFASFLIWMVTRLASAHDVATHPQLTLAQPSIAEQATILPFDAHFAQIVDAMPQSVDFQTAFTQALAGSSAGGFETSVGEAPPLKKARHAQYHRHRKHGSQIAPSKLSH